MLIITADALVGSDIRDVFRSAKLLAGKLEVGVEIRFNNVCTTIWPHSDLDHEYLCYQYALDHELPYLPIRVPKDYKGWSR